MRNDRRCVKVGDTRPPMQLTTWWAAIDLRDTEVYRSVDGGPYEKVEIIDPLRGLVPLPKLLTPGTHDVDHEIHWANGDIQTVPGEVDVVE